MCSHLFHKILPKGIAVGEAGWSPDREPQHPRPHVVLAWPQKAELPHFPAEQTCPGEDTHP